MTITKSRITCKCGKSFAFRNWPKHKQVCGLARNEQSHPVNSPAWNCVDVLGAMERIEKRDLEKLANWNAGLPVEAK